jgi:hypothetical protein
MTDAPDLITEIDAAVTSLLQKVAEDGTVSDRIDGIKIASAWLAQRAKLEPPKVAKGGGKFDQLRDQFHNGGTSKRRGAAAKAANGADTADDGGDPAPDA